jgi:AbrB family looped-hinge helix DNA binding protein
MTRGKERPKERELGEVTGEEWERRAIVKGYMRPDGTSYYVVIPKEVRKSLRLKGGEYFVMKTKPSKRAIELKVVELVEEGPP